MADPSIFGTFFQGKGGKLQRDEGIQERLLRESAAESAKATKKEAESVKQESGAVDRLSDTIKGVASRSGDSSGGSQTFAWQGPQSGVERRSEQFRQVNERVGGQYAQLEQNRLVRQEQNAAALEPSIRENLDSRNRLEQEFQPLQQAGQLLRNKFDTGLNNLATNAGAIIPGFQAVLDALKLLAPPKNVDPDGGRPIGWKFIHERAHSISNSHQRIAPLDNGRQANVGGF
jgi:hypothetical protein